MTTFVQKQSPVFRSLSIFLFLSTSISSVDARPAPARKLHAAISTKHSITINRSRVSKKYRVRLYADYNQEAMFFSASGPKQKIYQLYLFDLAGTLVKQASVLHKQTTLVEMTSKGTYLFEVFSDDERIESGEVLVN